MVPDAASQPMAPTLISAAYDAVAADYDRLLARDRWIRTVLWRHHLRLFHPGDRIVDVGCGTGIDTLHLARQGIAVTAVDASPAMIEKLRTKLAGSPLAARVDVLVGDANELARTLPGGFAGMISSFAALNTIDLPALADSAARLVRPGGRLVFHLLAPRPALVVQIGETAVPHQCPTADELEAPFAARGFRRRACYGLGFLVRRRMERWLPTAIAAPLGRLEAAIGDPRRGRFFVLDLERR
jgi:ubiquinone/menaquinone biosynthesis C-methylase UbiE